MKAYEGVEAIELLQNRINEHDVSDKASTLLREFISWVKGNESSTQVIPVLYAWYQMLEHIDFELIDPSPDDISRLVEHAEEEDRDEWKSSLNLFYIAFMKEEKGMLVDLDMSLISRI